MIKSSTTKRNQARGGGKIPRILLVAAAFLASLSLQAQSITLNIENATIGRVLETIQKEYGYSFSINTGAVDISQKVTVKADASDIEDVLEQIFKNASVEYRIDGKIISVNEKRTDDRASGEKEAVISGHVADSENFPLAGVAVVVKGMAVGTSTDADGYFSLFQVWSLESFSSVML